ncbi:hypothetical protein, partial [Klebsiella pneumoniae]|uniref:hypothetical protein n=1 Tax=Klebsiella pneumoniae TaxID=573 RepID=UPI002730C20C
FYRSWSGGGGWPELIAELTKYYGWGPRDAWSLTLKELVEWNIRLWPTTAHMEARPCKLFKRNIIFRLSEQAPGKQPESLQG